MREHDFEPVPGLPERLPRDERIVWQGAPNWETLAQRGFHLRAFAVYFAVLVAWVLISAVSHDATPREVAISGAKFSGLAFAAIGLIALFAWIVGRTTSYTITSRRVVMRFGIALPMTVNIPFSQIAAAGLRLNADGSGDIPLRVLSGRQLAYPLLWPHSRPWHITAPQPMLRAIPEAAKVAEILAQAVADVAPESVQVMVTHPAPAERPLVAAAA